MIRAIGLVFLGAFSFVLALACLLYFSGKLNQDTFDILMGKKPPVEPAVAAPRKPDDVDIITRALNQREEALNKRQAELDEREKQTQIREEDLARKIADIQVQLEDLRILNETLMATEDQARADRVSVLAETMGKMKPDNAATALSEFEIDDAAEILEKVEIKARGKILDALKDKAAPILEAMQATK